MKKDLNYIREKHSEAVRNISEHIKKSNQYIIQELNDEIYLDFKFTSLFNEYQKYVNSYNRFFPPDGTYRENWGWSPFGNKKTIEELSINQKKLLNKSKRIAKMSRREYVNLEMNKGINAYDHLLYGDCVLNNKINNDTNSYVKIVSGEYLRRYAIKNFKGSYIIMYNSEDVGKSRVILRESAMKYFEAIVSDDKWKAMPYKKRIHVLQNFKKFENFCYLEDFLQFNVLYCLSKDSSDNESKNLYRIENIDFWSFQSQFFRKRSKRSKKGNIL